MVSWWPSASGGPQRWEPGAETYGFLKLTDADATRHEMRYGSQLRTSLALSNPVPNVLDELTHVLGHVEVLTRYHTNSEL